MSCISSPKTPTTPTPPPDSPSLLTAGDGGGSSHSKSSWSSSSGRATQQDQERASIISQLNGSSSALSLIQPSSLRSSSLLVPHNSITENTFTIDKLQFEKLRELYGRKEQVQKLQDIFQQECVSSQKQQLVLLGGAAGTGKTALAQSIRGRVQDHYGIYISGKFDLMQEEEPFCAVADAFQFLCEELLLHREGMSFHRWKFSYQDFLTKMKETFDQSDIELLSSIIPNIAEVVGSVPQLNTATLSTGPSSEYTNTKQRIQYALGQFIQLLTSLGPLVLVLDDLHWINQDSLELLDSLLRDETTKSLMIVASYRDNEVDEEHMLWQSIQKWKSDIIPTQVSTVKIGDMSLENVHAIIQDLLSTSAAKTEPLASLVHQKTAGNAFFVKQFLLTLQKEKQLTFHFGSMCWMWDVEQIRATSMATENVAALLSQNLQNLPANIKSLLPRIACLGSRFKESTFHDVERHYFTRKQMTETIQQYQQEKTSSNGGAASKENSHTDKIPDLTFFNICQKEGLIENYGQGWYKWVHDKIQETALALMNESELGRIRFDLGKFLLGEHHSGDLPSGDVFLVSNLINAGAEHLSEEKEGNFYNDVLHLNLRAGKMAFASSAFGPAAVYFTKGMALLPTVDKWGKLFETTLELYSGAAEAHFCNGDHQLTRDCCREIIEREDVPLIHKKRAYNAQLHSLAAQCETEAARDLALHVLAKLGCKFPSSGRPFFTVAGILRILMTLKCSIEKIGSLQPMRDDEKEWVIYLLDRLGTMAFQCDEELMPLTFLKGLRWTLDYGTAELTAPVLSTVGVLLAGTLGNFAAGKKYADLALKYMTLTTEARTKFVTYHFVYHYQLPSKLCKRKLLEAYDAGLKSGDLESAFWSIYSFVEMQIHTGARLPNLLQDCAMYCRQMELFKQDMILLNTKLPWQLAANLASKSSNKHILKGDILDETDMLSNGQDHTTRQLLRFKTFAAFWFNEHHIVVQLMEENLYHKFSVEKTFPGANGHGTLYFHCALSCISVARASAGTKNKIKHLRRARRFLKRIKEWVTKGNPNVEHYQYLLEAEMMAMTGNFIGSRMLYQAAIASAGRKGLINDQALAHERFADCALANKDSDDARYHYQHALELYNEWGALAKVDLLRKSQRDQVTPVGAIHFDDRL